MLRGALSVVLLAGLGAVAQAAEVQIPNGGFETDPTSGTGFTQSITNWTVSFTGVPPSNDYSGVFTSFSGYTAPEGSQFALINNLGAGTVTLTSTVFALTDRAVQARYVYVTDDPPTSVGRDGFTVQIDFFTDAAGTISAGPSIVATPTTSAPFASLVGASPFGTGGITYAGPDVPSNFGLVNIPVDAFLGSFARISFTVDNLGPSGNGNGVSGVMLDDVLLTPEPSTLALFGLGVLGMGGIAWRRRRARKTAPRA